VEPGVEAYDARDGNITDQIVVTGIVDMNRTGDYTLTYTVADAAGNKDTKTRKVTVVGSHSVDLNATVAMDMIWCPPGTFTMGSPTTEAGRGTDETEHNVSLTKGFYLGKYEVTQAQYEAVMTGVTGDRNATPSNWHGNPNRPVENVSWDDAQVFLTRLNAQQVGNLPIGWSYVLPTESQWEYACRAGTTTDFSWGDGISSTNANYNWDGGPTNGNDFKQTRDVGQYSANPWGFFDMHGNVWEWTSDWYQAAYPMGNPVVDPTGAASGSYRALRGSSWYSGGATLRSARRRTSTPGYRGIDIGFRVSLHKSH
jgi:formylglycine-generating enzyme required for sulfatase activity